MYNTVFCSFVFPFFFIGFYRIFFFFLLWLLWSFLPSTIMVNVRVIGRRSSFRGGEDMNNVYECDGPSFFYKKKLQQIT